MTTDGILRIATGTASTPTNITVAITGSQIVLSWPADHTGWQLQAQTNGLAVGLDTNWSNVAGSGSTNQLTLPVNATDEAVFFRLARP